MLISLITVTYNAESSIRRTLDSIRAQSYSDFELIIIDGGSSDNTLNILHDYEEIISYQVSESDKGIYDAMNKGILLSKSEWIFFLNSGDYFYNSKVLENISNSLINLSNEFDLLYGKSLLYSNTLNISHVKGKQISLKDLYFKMPLTHQSMFFRKKSLLTTKGFDLNFKRSADHDWLCKFFINKGKAYFYNDIISYYEIESSAANSIWFRKYEKLKISYKYFNIKIKLVATFKFLFNYIRAITFNIFLPDSTKNILIKKRFKNKFNN